MRTMSGHLESETEEIQEEKVYKDANGNILIDGD